MISEASSAGLMLEPTTGAVRLRISRVLSVVAYVSLLAIMVVGVIPYGASEFWWKALLMCAVFATSIVCLIESYLSDDWKVRGAKILLPPVVLALFAWLQTISFGTTAGTAGLSPMWTSISADPFSTRFFVLELVALILLAALFYRYTNSDLRLQSVVNLIIGIAVVTAVFGILRQTTQHSTGFGLPLLKVDQGYGQFINKNHFAFLMEMGFGLALGNILAGTKRERGLIYLGALLPIWTALVLSNSRGGILAMLAQIVSATLLFSIVQRRQFRINESKSVRLLGSLPARAAILIVLVVGVAFGTLWLGGDRLASRLEQANEEFDQVTAEVRQNARRNQIWRATWNMFAAHPIAGVGMGAYWIAIAEFHDASGTMTPQEAHNDYLELLASGGLLGFGLGIWFVVLVFRRVRENLQLEHRLRRAAAFGASLALIGVAVHSLVDFGLHIFGNAIVFTALIVIATAYPPSKKQVLVD